MKSNKHHNANTSLLATLWHCLSLKTLATGLLFLSGAQASSTHTSLAHDSIADYTDNSIAGDSDGHIDRAISRFSEQVIRDVQTGPLVICNKHERSLAIRESLDSPMSTFKLSHHRIPACGNAMNTMRDAVDTAILTERLKFTLVENPTWPCKPDDYQEYTQSVQSRALAARTTNTYGIAQCGELDHQATLKFLQSTDETLVAQRIASVLLDNALHKGVENHQFSIIFPGAHAPGSDKLETNLLQLANEYPEAVAIDTWNHLSFKLGALLHPNQFHQRVAQSMRFTLYEGKRPGGRLPNKHKRLSQIKESLPEKVKNYYLGFTTCNIELLPKVPHKACRPTLSS